MRSFPIIAAILFSALPASADPALFQPDGCDFALTFPAAPHATQAKTATDRGDDVITNKAELHLDVIGKANIFRAECTRIPHMGFVDEAILANNMRDLATAYNFANPIVSVLRSKSGPVGVIHARLQLGGKTIAIELRRYTGPNNILDVWTGAEPDGFPSEADTAFLATLKLNGAALQ